MLQLTVTVGLMFFLVFLLYKYIKSEEKEN